MTGLLKCEERIRFNETEFVNREQLGHTTACFVLFVLGEGGGGKALHVCVSKNH